MKITSMFTSQCYSVIECLNRNVTSLLLSLFLFKQMLNLQTIENAIQARMLAFVCMANQIFCGILYYWKYMN